MDSNVQSFSIFPPPLTLISPAPEFFFRTFPVAWRLTSPAPLLRTWTVWHFRSPRRSSPAPLLLYSAETAEPFALISPAPLLLILRVSPCSRSMLISPAPLLLISVRGEDTCDMRNSPAPLLEILNFGVEMVPILTVPAPEFPIWKSSVHFRLSAVKKPAPLLLTDFSPGAYTVI